MTQTDSKHYYREKYSGSVFLIKAGGRIITDPQALSDLLGTIRDLLSAEIRVLLIYGGGDAIDEALNKAGLESKKVNGRRITNATTIPVVKATITGQLGFTIGAEMRRIAMPGLCLNMIPPAWGEIALRQRDPEDYGYDGTLRKVHPAPVLAALNANSFIACPCVGISEHDGVNINADLAAIALASGCQARKLIFLSDVDGVRAGNKTLSTLSDDEIPGLIESGAVTDGMRVKLESCLEALDRGVNRIHLLNGFESGALAREVYDPVGTGTMILRAADRKRYENELKIKST